MTLNVHSFISSNLNDTFEIVINKLKELLNKFSIDFCFIEEFSSYINDDYMENVFNDYNILKSPNLGNKKDKYFGNVLLCKDKINKYKFVELSQGKNGKRMATIFNVDNKNVFLISFSYFQIESIVAISEYYILCNGSNVNRIKYKIFPKIKCFKVFKKILFIFIFLQRIN